MENKDFIYMTDGKRCPKIHNSEECIAQALKDGFRKATDEEIKAYLESKGKKPTVEKKSEVEKEVVKENLTTENTSKKTKK